MAVQPQLPEKHAGSNVGSWLGFALMFVLGGIALLATAQLASDYDLARICFALAIACILWPSLGAAKRRLTPTLGISGALLGMFGLAALGVAAALVVFRFVGDLSLH